MRFLKQCLIIFGLLGLPVFVSAQEFTLPANIVLKTNRDYLKYEKDVLAAISWLEQTPLNEQGEKRKRISAFVQQWVSGSPNVSVKMYAEIMVFYDANPDLLTNYMGGWTRYVLGNPGDTIDFNANMAGLKSVIAVYKTGKGIKKDPKTEKLVKLDREGKLEAWAREHFKD